MTQNWMWPRSDSQVTWLVLASAGPWNSFSVRCFTVWMSSGMCAFMEVLRQAIVMPDSNWTFHQVWTPLHHKGRNLTVKLATRANKNKQNFETRICFFFLSLEIDYNLADFHSYLNNVFSVTCTKVIAEIRRKSNYFRPCITQHKPEFYLFMEEEKSTASL